jgi:hypothetical protein
MHSFFFAHKPMFTRHEAKRVVVANAEITGKPEVIPQGAESPVIAELPRNCQ